MDDWLSFVFRRQGVSAICGKTEEPIVVQTFCGIGDNHEHAYEADKA